MAKVDKLKGRVKEAAGDLIDDAEIRRKGRLEQREAEARDELARTEEEADRKAKAGRRPRAAVLIGFPGIAAEPRRDRVVPQSRVPGLRYHSARRWRPRAP